MNKDYDNKMTDFIVEATDLLNKQKEMAEEIRVLTRKHRQAFNGLVGVAIACFLPLLYSFVSLNVTVGKLQETTVPKDEVYNKFVQKIDALAVHQLESDWVKTQFYKITHDEYFKTDETTQKIINAFYSTESRSGQQ